MNNNMKMALSSALYGVLLNLVLPMVFKMVPIKRDDSFFGKFAKMLDSHKDMPVVSSVIVALVVFLSCLLSANYKLM